MPVGATLLGFRSLSRLRKSYWYVVRKSSVLDLWFMYHICEMDRDLFGGGYLLELGGVTSVGGGMCGSGVEA